MRMEGEVIECNGEGVNTTYLSQCYGELVRMNILIDVNGVD